MRAVRARQSEQARDDTRAKIIAGAVNDCMAASGWIPVKAAGTPQPIAASAPDASLSPISDDRATLPPTNDGKVAFGEAMVACRQATDPFLEQSQAGSVTAASNDFQTCMKKKGF
jgi:hypothetical protein